jgi:putative ABC transport system substrate-binding protein
MKRREFIALAGGAAAWPLSVRAQFPERMRRIGVLMGYSENDPEAQNRLAAFTQGLVALGWSEGRNLRSYIRWTAGDMNHTATLASELVALRPEVILSNTTPVTAALQRETHTIPLVFVIVSDPVGSGFVKSLSRPGGNITGFINLEASLAQKWVELLKEIAPSVTKTAVMFNPDTAPYAAYYIQPLQVAAAAFGVSPFAAPVRSEHDIEAAIAALGREPGSGLVLMTDSFIHVHRKTIIELSSRHKVPTMGYGDIITRDGGLISYGIDSIDLFARAAPYVDRILRGANPAELPVEQPTKFELMINLRTAKELGLTVSPALFARANEVME